MGNILTEFNSFVKIKDNETLLELAKEYICHDVFLVKIGNEVKENIDQLKKNNPEFTPSSELSPFDRFSSTTALYA